MWKEIIVTDWKQFNQHIERFSDKHWVYRGQNSEQWLLESSLHRECKAFKSDIDNKKCVEIERKMEEEFKSSYKLYSNFQISEPKNDDVMEDWLEERLTTFSVMQHYGTPTRFLDWTHSPFIASFFALDGATKRFCIYALNLKQINQFNESISVNAFQRNRIFYDTRNPIKPFLYPYHAIEKNHRLRVQQGLFLVPSLINMTFDDILKDYGIENGLLNGEETAVKLIFDNDDLQYWWFKLIQMNITHETIYPGLEGFCKSLKLNIFK
ncbi:FRG domain-containing protein [Planococcus lenghuensis]|uniref:FRG domain-containing protein n=1 Tax=Planococcus lenghuensis TaxID=2213202 RepID=A0A1Q2L4F0_9BACL|nr:FRG domain-containing protein [Planococcus lenghuensis]AQQ55254.1 hypothetical protein B0X71_18910 [Planococcus lenghuensis]